MPEVLEARASEARQASGGAADGAMISAALRGGSCASVLESGDDGRRLLRVRGACHGAASIVGCRGRGRPSIERCAEGTLRRDFAKGLFEGTSLDFLKGLSKRDFRRDFSQGLNIWFQEDFLTGFNPFKSAKGIWLRRDFGFEASIMSGGLHVHVGGGVERRAPY